LYRTIFLGIFNIGLKTSIRAGRARRGMIAKCPPMPFPTSSYPILAPGGHRFGTACGCVREVADDDGRRNLEAATLARADARVALARRWPAGSLTDAAVGRMRPETLRRACVDRFRGWKGLTAVSSILRAAGCSRAMQAGRQLYPDDRTIAGLRVVVLPTNRVLRAVGARKRCSTPRPTARSLGPGSGSRTGFTDRSRRSPRRTGSARAEAGGEIGAPVGQGLAQCRAQLVETALLAHVVDKLFQLLDRLLVGREGSRALRGPA